MKIWKVLNNICPGIPLPVNATHSEFTKQSEALISID